MKFDRKKFFQGFRERIDPTIEQEQVSGLEFLLGQMESDPFWKYVPQIAYTLATVYHETAGSFQPVVEGYYLAQTDPPDYAGKTARVKAFQKKLRYFPYFGRGYVQLTWKRNYEKAGDVLGLDLVNKPELALEPDGAYQTMTYGMHQGWFTDKKLDDYIKGTKKDYTNARKIINGLDKAGLIAGYARAFEKILNESVSSKLVPGAETFNSDLDSAAIGQQTAEDSSTKLETLTALHGQSETTAADSSTTQQVAETITITGDAPIVPPDFVPENVTVSAPPPTGFIAKIKAQIAALLVFVGGGAGLKEYFNVTFSPEIVEILKVLLPVVFGLGFLGVMVWFVVEKIVGFKTMQMKAGFRADPNSHNVTVIPGEERTRWYQFWR